MFGTNGGGCMGHLGGPDIVSFCPALRQLFDEHPLLREQMQQIVEKAKRLPDVAEEERHTELQELRALENKFRQELDIHSEKEEGGLFPILGRHIGTGQGPIAVMEYEHTEAKRNLALFEQQAAETGEAVGREQVQAVTAPLLTAIHILLEHFMKEESVLFPMAERVLTEQEKQELLAIVQQRKLR